jgi:hypothetical protein
VAASPQPLKRSKFINLFVFAEPGWGKTRLAGTSADPLAVHGKKPQGKVLLIHPPTDHTDAILPQNEPGIEEIITRDWDDIWEARDYVRHEGQNYDWVWLDNISLLQDHGLDDIWDTVIKEKPQRARYGMDKQEYGINFHRLGESLRHIVGARVTNFGMTAHTAWLPSNSDEESDDPQEKLMPWVQGKNMAPKFCGYMNMVAFGDVTKKGTRVLHFNNTQGHYGKDAYDAFLDNDHKLLNPTVPKIVRAVKAARKASGSKTASKGKAKARRRKTTTRKG